MTQLIWSETLTVGYPPMDDLHRNFVQQLWSVEHSKDSELAQAWSDLIDCTESVFEQENTWMRTSRFGSASNHTLQHRVVLNIMREGLAQARSGHPQEVRQLVQELASWFAKHIQSLDAALALHLKSCEAPTPRHIH